MSDKAGPAKRVKQELEMTSIVQERLKEDDVDIESPFTVAEMWALVPGHVRDELFDHLNLRQATRLIRVSASWDEDLRKIPERSKGIAVLRSWTTVKMEPVTTAGQDGVEEASKRPQIFSAVPKFVPVTHLILLDKNDATKHARYGEYGFPKWILPSLRTITLGEPFTGSVLEPMGLVRLLLSSLDQLIIFRKWRLAVSIRFKLDNPTEQINRIFQAEADAVEGHDGVLVLFVNMGIDCPNFKMGAGLTESWYARSVTVWRLLNSQHMLWPYPHEQTVWLLKSLSNLNGDVLETVKLLDANWIESGFWNGSEDLRPVLDRHDVTSKATANGRRLSSLDLAFLGRLLVFLDKYEKIPGQEPPPFPFSTELEIGKSFM